MNTNIIKSAISFKYEYFKFEWYQITKHKYK